MEEEKSKKGKALKTAAACLLGAVILAGVFLAGWMGHYLSLGKEVRTYLWAKSVAEKNYYRPADEAELYEKLYGTLSLDDYSKLYSPEEYAAYAAKEQGQNSGVGISVSTQESGTPLRIVSVTEGSPACLAGICKGMYLTAFGTDTPRAGTFEELKALIAESETVRLVCGSLPDGSDGKTYDVTPRAYRAAFVSYRDSAAAFGFRYETTEEGERRVLEERGVPLAGADGKTAYLRLDGFLGRAGEEFAQCLSLMKERGRENLIVDLRGNGGGYLDILAQIASHLLKGGDERPVVAVAKYRNGETGFRCGGNDYSSYFSEHSRIVVLADENSASASECLIGALSDYGTVLPQDIFLRENENGSAKTYGKGIMQSQFEGPSGAVMKLTVAKVYWPLSGKCIDGTGVTPADGATPVPAPSFYGEEDVMLERALSSF